MSNRTPSLLALLGIAAAAGYQNRDKLKSMIDGFAAKDQAGAIPANTPVDTAPGLEQRSAPSFLDTLQTGIAELMHRFKQTGDEPIAKSWVGTGQNIAVTPDQLRQSLGRETIADLMQKTGLTELDLLARLAQVLPETVDQLTPSGDLQLSTKWQNPTI